MTARLGMANLIAKLRSNTSTDVGDITINSVAYWTDDQLQTILDRHSKMVRDVQLLSNPLVTNGITEYKEFYIPKIIGADFETADTAGQFVLLESSFVIVSSGLYTVDYNIGLVTFSSDFGSSTLYLRARVFDMNSASVDVWMEKAAHRASLIDWRAGSQGLSEDQEYQHCLQMANMYQGRSGLKLTRVIRSDYDDATW